jgi:hypothetical protein
VVRTRRQPTFLIGTKDSIIIVIIVEKSKYLSKYSDMPWGEVDPLLDYSILGSNVGRFGR